MAFNYDSQSERDRLIYDIVDAGYTYEEALEQANLRFPLEDASTSQQPSFTQLMSGFVPWSPPYISTNPSTAPNTTQQTPNPSYPPTQQQTPAPSTLQTPTASNPPSRGWSPVATPSPQQTTSTHGRRRSSGTRSQALGTSSGAASQAASPHVEGSRRTSITGSGSGSGSRPSTVSARRSSSSGSGCLPCFGSARIPDDADDEPAEDGTYYTLSNETGGPFLDDRGVNLQNQLRGLTNSTYKNCFLPWSEQKPKHFNYIVSVLHARFPNPPNYRFSEDWARKKVKTLLNNKRSRIRRLARAAVEKRDEKRLIPSMCTSAEWKFALKEVHDGVQFPQQKAAHKKQLETHGATHWGRGGKDAWKDRFRAATNRRPKTSEIEYRRYHNERATWSHFLDIGSITQEEYLSAMARYTRDNDDEEIEEEGGNHQEIEGASIEGGSDEHGGDGENQEDDEEDEEDEEDED